MRRRVRAQDDRHRRNGSSVRDPSDAGGRAGGGAAMMPALRESRRRSGTWLAARYDGLRLRPDAVEVARARGFAEAAATRCGFGPAAQEDFKLATSEAVSNAIEHGLPCPDGAIHRWI